VVKHRGSSPTWRETGLNSTFFLCFFQRFFKASLKIGILKLYTNGFTVELAKYRTFTNQSEIGGKHCLQNSLMVNTTKAGSHKISDTATTIQSVLESRALRSIDLLLGTCK